MSILKRKFHTWRITRTTTTAHVKQALTIVWKKVESMQLTELSHKQQHLVKMDAAFLSRLFQVFREGNELLQMKIDQSLAELKRSLSTTVTEDTITTYDLELADDEADSQTISTSDDCLVEDLNHEKTKQQHCSDQLYLSPLNELVPGISAMDTSLPIKKLHLNPYNDSVRTFGDVLFLLSKALWRNRWRSKLNRVWDWTAFMIT